MPRRILSPSGKHRVIRRAVSAVIWTMVAIFALCWQALFIPSLLHSSCRKLQNRVLVNDLQLWLYFGHWKAIHAEEVHWIVDPTVWTIGVSSVLGNSKLWGSCHWWILFLAQLWSGAVLHIMDPSLSEVKYRLQNKSEIRVRPDKNRKFFYLVPSVCCAVDAFSSGVHSCATQQPDWYEMHSPHWSMLQMVLISFWKCWIRYISVSLGLKKKKKKSSLPPSPFPTDSPTAPVLQNLCRRNEWFLLLFRALCNCN